MGDNQDRLFLSLPQPPPYPLGSLLQCFRCRCIYALFTIPILRNVTKVEAIFGELSLEGGNVGAGITGPFVCLLEIGVEF